MQDVTPIPPLTNIADILNVGIWCKNDFPPITWPTGY